MSESGRALSAVGAEVSYQQPIRRELTHRAAVSEVFVTSLAARGPGRFVAGAQLPRMHAYYGDHPGVLAARHDLLAVMETARQAAIALTHEFYEVPLDSMFVVRTFNGTGVPGPIWACGAEPADLVVDVEVMDLHDRDAAVCGLETVLAISCAGRPLATVDGSFSWVPPDRWSALRAAFREKQGLGADIGPAVSAKPAAPAAVGRRDARNVVVGQAEGDAGAPLAVDTAHPFLFDHRLDHLPGSVLLEAARQTALLLQPGLPEQPQLIGIRSRFDRFTELDVATECRLEPAGPAPQPWQASCTIRQDDKTTAELELTFLDASETG
ncbi:ScbA/BarX family gamma-butyrolactone biosynthesis protein [Nocardia carnea]|uniref:ScbA/BarX family gamma-butyrolactone biosynthesis protein n=1 Tax=Nocardia carnea TaxID=37328 RepID=A0ABW7TP82_9NOCA|nr:ScbA/BarX family gamma-butyrolactone biosynthesis protein [Nocardia carnea]